MVFFALLCGHLNDRTEEICEVEEYKTTLIEKIGFLQHFISSPVTSPESQSASLAVHPTSSGDTETTNETDQNVKQNQSSHHHQKQQLPIQKS